jgi:pyridoxal phosphate enzyme (YggS family)
MTIQQRIESLQADIQQAILHSHRKPNAVKLIAVSKGQPIEALEQAIHAGQLDFAESYWQEAQSKIKHLGAHPICWHYIGPIQSNKTQGIAQQMAWVHSLDRSKIALKLNEQRPSSLAPLNICIQVNFDHEDNKAGVAPEDAAELASVVLQLPRLHLRGLMMIPKPCHNEQEQYLSFMRAVDLLTRLNQTLRINMDTLSMGMSHDWPAAIKAGSTMLRIGTGIFGDRHHAD